MTDTHAKQAAKKGIIKKLRDKLLSMREREREVERKRNVELGGGGEDRGESRE